MGVPAFYRWLSEKYPKIVLDVLEERVALESGSSHVRVPFDCTNPNPNSIEFDNLYIDMNGIIHPCSHPENGPQPKNEMEMYQNVCHYVDHLFRVYRPRQLLYLAVDGVAPRAKMNQQRARRFRSAQEARELVELEKKIRHEVYHDDDDDDSDDNDGNDKSKEKEGGAWDSNVITPGTPFMIQLAEFIRFYIRKRIQTDPAWQTIRVIFSDASLPGEGEHKIMNHIRIQRACAGYNPNTVHVLHGLDADLIMLALATHEAHFYISREEVLFGRRSEEAKERRQMLSGHKDKQIELNEKVGDSAMQYLLENQTKPLQLISIPILREYLANEFQSCLQPNRLPFPVSLERLIDDFVFMCFFVGNDFLPHLPSLDIRDGALDYLINVYQRILPGLGDYITKSGGNVNLSHVDVLLSEVGQIEDYVFQMKYENEQRDAKRREDMNHRKKQNDARNKKNMIPNLLTAAVPEEQHVVRGKAAKILEKQQQQAENQQAVDADMIALQSTKKKHFTGKHTRFDDHVDTVVENGDAQEKNTTKKSSSSGKNMLKVSHMKGSDNAVAAAALKKTLLNNDNNEKDEAVIEDNRGKSKNKKEKKKNKKEKNTTDDTMELEEEDDSAPKVPNGTESTRSKRKLDNIAKNGVGEVGDAEDEFDADDDDDDDEIEDVDVPKIDEIVKIVDPALALAVKEKVKAAQQAQLDQYAKTVVDNVRLHEAGWKDRYYTDKCKADDVANHGGREHMFRSYIMGLCWVMKYYYDGVPSWKWYYPFHYGPFASDLKNIERFEKDCKSFEICTPFNPVEQLMAVLPSDSAHAIPKASRWLLKDPDSPIIDFYPIDVPVDPNGKAMPWLWVVLLPFIDEDRLLGALGPTMTDWTPIEKLGNARGLDDGYLYVHRSMHPLSNKLSSVLVQATDKKSSAGQASRTKLSDTQYGMSGYVRPPLSNEFFPPDENVTVPLPSSAASIITTNDDDEDMGVNTHRIFSQPIHPNEAICVTFAEPDKYSHKSILLPGVRLPPPALVTAEDRSIRRPQLNRFGGTIANLGGNSGGMGQSHQSGYGSMNISQYERDLARQNGRGNEMYQAGTRTWGSMEPTPKRFHGGGSIPPPPPPPPLQGYGHHQQNNMVGGHNNNNRGGHSSTGGRGPFSQNNNRGRGGQHNQGGRGYHQSQQQPNNQHPSNQWGTAPVTTTAPYHQSGQYPQHNSPPPYQQNSGNYRPPTYQTGYNNQQQGQQQQRHGTGQFPNHAGSQFNQGSPPPPAPYQQQQQQSGYNFRQQGPPPPPPQQHQRQNQHQTASSANVDVMNSLRAQLTSTLNRNKNSNNNRNHGR